MMVTVFTILSCLVLVLACAYLVMAIVLAVKEHRTQMKINKKVAEALDKRLFELDNNAQDNADQEDMHGKL